MKRPWALNLHRPTSWEQALHAKASDPATIPLAGGTDVMVELNFGRSDPSSLLDLSRVDALRSWEWAGAELRIGSGVTYATVVDELGRLAPGLALAARTVGSPQIRNRGTIGGNLGSASPAGDMHPPLLAAAAEVEIASVRGLRRVPIDAFFTGPKRSVLAPDELIGGVVVPVGATSEHFAKVGSRNAMVIAACSFALTIDRDRRRVGTGVGSAGPTPLRCVEAEAFLTAWLAEHDAWSSPVPPTPEVAARFGELVAAGATPIDDVRATAAYRRHALRVLAQRALVRTWAGAATA